MILICNNVDHVLDYINNDYYKCLYLYLDIIKYGTNNPNIKVWIQKKEENTTAIVLKYYSGMHIFSKKLDLDTYELVSLVIQEKPSMICAEKAVIEKIECDLKAYDYESEYGWVRELSKLDKLSMNGDTLTAITMDDFEQITDLLLSDEDIGGSYTREGMLSQILERNKEKFGRNYIIKDDGKIVAHAGTGAENAKVAMLSYVITHPEYRGKGLATTVCSAVCEDLIKEGKKVYLINYSKESTALYDKLGFKVCCEWGKLFLNIKKRGDSNA